MSEPVDTNVVIRFLVEDPERVDRKFAGVFSFFDAIERGDRRALLPPLVLFQSYFVLVSYYGVPRAEAAGKLRDLLSLRGLAVPEKAVLRTCLDLLAEHATDLVDAYLAALCRRRGLEGVHSFDRSLRKLGVQVLPVA